MFVMIVSDMIFQSFVTNVCVEDVFVHGEQIQDLVFDFDFFNATA